MEWFSRKVVMTYFSSFELNFQENLKKIQNSKKKKKNCHDVIKLKNSWGEQEGNYIEVRYHFSVLDIVSKHIPEKLNCTPSNFFLCC